MKRTILAATTTVLMAAGCAGGKGGHGQGGPLVAAPITTSVRAVATEIGSLLEARDQAATALVGTGQVLVAGGATNRAVATDTAEMIDATGAVRPVLARMSTARAGAKAVRLDADRVLVVGGEDEEHRELASTELYTHSKRSFTVGPVLQAPRARASVAVVGSMIYVFGGAGQKSVEAIDARTLQVKRLAGELDQVHAGARVAVVGRTAIVGGGFDENPPEAYDLDGEKALPLAFRDQVRGDALVAIEESVLFVGGSGEAGFLTPHTKRFTDELRLNAPLGAPRVHGTAVSFMGGVLVIGGDDRNVSLATSDFIPSASSWEPGPELRFARRGADAVALADGRVVVVGGTGGSGGSLVAQCEMILPAGAALPRSSATFDGYTAEELALASKIRELETTQKLLAAAIARNQQLEKQLADVTAQRDQLQRDVVALKAQVATAQAALEQTRGALASANAQIATLKAQLASAQANASQLQGQLATQTATAANLQNQIAIFEARARNAENALGDANTQIASLKNTVASLQNQLATAQTQLKAAQAQAGAPATAAPTQTATASSGPSILYGATPSTNPTRPVIAQIDPITLTRGAGCRIWLTVHGSNNVVLFGGNVSILPGKGQFSAAYNNGVLMSYIDVTVPFFPTTVTNVAVQVVGDGLVSDAKFAFVK